jgi:hypothetical protein
MSAPGSHDSGAPQASAATAATLEGAPPTVSTGGGSGGGAPVVLPAGGTHSTLEAVTGPGSGTDLVAAATAAPAGPATSDGGPTLADGPHSPHTPPRASGGAGVGTHLGGEEETIVHGAGAAAGHGSAVALLPPGAPAQAR